MPGMPKIATFKRPLLLLLLVLVVAAFAFYSIQKPAEKRKGEKGRNAPAMVTLAPVRMADVPLDLKAIGNVEASETVAIQPQISGQLRKIHFRQGAIVNQGQLLFEIDPKLQRVSVAQANAMLSRSQATIQQTQSNVAKAQAQESLARANLVRDEAQLQLARTQEVRYRNLLAQNFVTREQYEQMRTALNTAQAAVSASQATVNNAVAQVQADRAMVQTAHASAAGDRASLESARIQLNYTRIYSPITGKTGPLLVNAGNLVQANMTSLVSIEKLDPVFVAFSVPEKELQSVQNAMRQGHVPVMASVRGESVRGETVQSATGSLFFIDNNVDPTSGTVRLKARYNNTDRILWPGRFVDVTVRLGTLNRRMLLPASAVQRGQQGDFVYVVENRRAKVRPVLVDRIVGGDAVIRQGLKPGDSVVRDGQMRLGPDIEVRIARSPS